MRARCHVLRLADRYPQGNLHNQRHLITEQRDQVCCQKAYGISDGRVGEKGYAAGNPDSHIPACDR